MVFNGGIYTQHVIDHDMTFTPANIAPEHETALSLSQFADHERDALTQKLRTDLDAQFAQAFCSTASSEPESAAHCAYLDPNRMPDWAHQRLREVFGDDEPLVAKLLVRPAYP